MTEKELGKVDDVELYIEDHGLLTIFVHIDFGGTHQGFGGFCLDTYNEKTERREGFAGGTDFILRLLQLFGVDRLEKIKGKPVYAIRDEDHSQILGLETPEFDGGKKFMAEDWQKRWFTKELKVAE